MDNLNVNIEELEKQRREEILKSGRFCLAEVIVGKGDREPIAHIAVENVSPIEVGTLILVLEQMVKTLIEKEPEAYLFAKQMNCKINTIEKTNEEKEEEQ